MPAPITVRGLHLDPPLLNGSGAVDVVSVDPDWNLPDDALRKLGAFVTKTVTMAPRTGHPQPWAEVWGEGSLVNAVGLANPGITAAMRDWRGLESRLGSGGSNLPVIVSVDGAPEDVTALVQLVDAAGWASGIELNLSCPNVAGGLVAADPAAVGHVVGLARTATDLPIFAKLSPASGDRAAIARAAQGAGADALTCGNTMPIRAVGPDGRPLLGAGPDGGLSGRALHHIALRLVAETAAAVDIPVIGLGGIESEETAQAMFDVGAAAIGVGTGAVLDPPLIATLARWLGADPP